MATFGGPNATTVTSQLVYSVTTTGSTILSQGDVNGAYQVQF